MRSSGIDVDRVSIWEDESILEEGNKDGCMIM